jgi:asparagine synthase (glutamine-hydrolysing)
MCGIFTLINNSYTFTPKAIRNSFMLGVNRGPEQSELKYIDDDVWFGFHRLAINGLDQLSSQPMTINGITLICNGEIYNYKELYALINIKPLTASDCEVIIHLYALYGLEYTLQLLDGVFAFILHDLRDDTNPLLHAARDPYGVRPLYIMNVQSHVENKEPIIAFASELKVLYNLGRSNGSPHSFGPHSFGPHSFGYAHVKPSSFISFTKVSSNPLWTVKEERKYNCFQFNNLHHHSFEQCVDVDHDTKLDILNNIYTLLNLAVKKRVIGTSDRKIACLLSGGLDSSLIAALVSKYYDGVLETYSIGMPGSEDVKHAELVAKHLGTKHTSVIVSEDDFFNAIPEVIKEIESYDTTTVRASVGNYLIGKYIREHSDAKVIFNGDGSDELTGGYLYFKAAPNDVEFDRECKRLLSNIYAFDVLRSDKCISSHGLEPRTPFLDRAFVDYYLNIPMHIRNTNKTYMEKYLLRSAFITFEPTLLPECIIWRKKEAFSDGVSSINKSWFQIINEKIIDLVNSGNIVLPNSYKIYDINPPTTLEQRYYRYIYDTNYPQTAYIVPYFWMPKYVNATDASARTLELYIEA